MLKMNYTNLKKYNKSLNEIFKNTKNYRKEWEDNLKEMIVNTLENIQKEIKFDSEIVYHEQYQGLEAVSLTAGSVESGIYERVDKGLNKPLIRMNGMLTFQQLFNGKISIWINYPYIEGIGEPKPPKMLEIVRPEELKEVNILRYMEDFLKSIAEWEDYDDDVVPSPAIGFNHAAASIKK